MLAVILVVAALIRLPRFSARQVGVVCAFIGIFAVQSVATDNFTLVTTLGFFIRLTIAFGAAMLVRDFPKSFISVMFWTALTSLPIYILLIATNGALASMVGPFAFHVPDPHILIYYFPPVHATQNNSYFWEPGVYGGYLILAIVFLGAKKSEYEPRKYRLILYVLLLAVATTQSTGAYVTVLLAMVYHGKALGRHPMVRVLLLFTAVLGMAYAFQKASFLGDKIQTQFEVVDAQSRSWQLTRLGSLLSDWRQIQVHPWFGWGPNPEGRYQLVQKDTLSAQGNGLSNFTAQFGFVGLAVFLVCCWSGFRSLFEGREGRATLALLIVVLVLNDECFLNFPIFMALMFMHGSELPVRVSAPRSGRGRIPALSFSRN